MFSRIGTFPNRPWNRWKRKRYIRDDSDRVSDDFARVLGEGAWYLDQTPEPLGLKSRPPDKYLIYGFGEVIAPGHRREIVPTSYVDLLRVNRRCYKTALDDHYGRHTISFFGAEMLTLFMNNASCEGLERIRYVHLGIPMAKRGGWARRKGRKSLALAITHMSKAFKGLQELDLEIVLLWDPKAGTLEDFSNWLVDEALLGLRGLKKFVLKVSVLEKVVRMLISEDVWVWKLRPLSVLSDSEYAALKRRITERLKS